MTTRNDFAGKWILITGGGTGLGKAFGLHLAGRGANLILTSRSEAHLEAGATAMRAAGAEVVTLPCDLRQPDAVETMIATAFDRAGGTIHGLVNNAAGNIAAPTARLSANAFNAVVATVLHGSYYATHAIGCEWLKRKQTGTVLSIVTTYAWTGSAFVVPSACAKAGVLAMTRSLAVEWGPRGIRLNAIAPGPFPTEGAWKRLMPEELEHEMIARNPCRRMGKPEELAGLVGFLLSDEAAYINGECVTIDGGEWLAGAGQFNALGKLTAEDWATLEKKARS
jgi:NAD(P)-dependent dehydrogenase (short-subunit alcohol dehydrogenase family)